MTNPAINMPCVLLLKRYEPIEKRTIVTRTKKRMRGEIWVNLSKVRLLFGGKK